MPRFTYKGINETGKTVSGAVDADSIDAANEIVAGRGVTVVDMSATSLSTSTSKLEKRLEQFGGVRTEELILYTKQLSTMLKAGIPVLRIFEILETQTETERLKRISVEIAQDIRAGSSLHAALGKHPSVFSRLYCSMVQAGEASGALPQVLQRLIYVISHEYKVKSDVRAAVQYPILVLVALVIAFVVLLTMVIPRFAKIYAGVNLELPWPTLVCIALSNFMRNQWMLIVGALVILVVGYWIAMRRPEARLWRDRMFMRIPLIGNLLVKSALSRFASIFSILQSAGVGILDALNILAETIGNAAMTKELQRVQYLLEEGHGIARPLRSARYFTPMFVNMVAIGEESGNLDEMLREVSSHYDSEVEYATRKLTTALGPMLIVLLSAMVGFFALAVYLPMWDLAKIATQSQ